MRHSIVRSFRLALVALMVFAGGAGIVLGGGGATGTGGPAYSAFGMLSDFGSIFVNGIEFFTDKASITINGVPNRPESDLRIGMVLSVHGSIDGSGKTGNATTVDYHADALGMVDVAPVQGDTGGSFGVLGQTIATDARTENPITPLPTQPVHHTGGDVLARYLMRVDEFAASIRLITTLCEDARPLHIAFSTRNRLAAGTGVGIVEGWRGTIVHRVETNADGVLSRVKIVDPSWFNWPAVPLALTDTIVPDFPLINKSFNLSYAGNDL